MKPRAILDAIAAEFPLIVRNEHHVQIDLGGGKFHDLWIAEHGRELKVRLYGERSTEFCENLGRLQKRLRAYTYESTDLASLRQIERLVELVKRKPGIWVDAGWKDGNARIAVIATAGFGFDVSVRDIEATTSSYAEEWAVEFAKKRYPGDAPIFTDHQALAGGRVVWVPREENKAADKLSNLRAKPC